MELSDLQSAIKRQRGVTVLGSFGDGIEVDVDQLEALVAIALAADHVIGQVTKGDFSGDEAEVYGFDELHVAVNRLYEVRLTNAHNKEALRSNG